MSATNATDEYRPPVLLQDLLARHRNSSAIALQMGQKSIQYKEYFRLSTGLANRICAHGCKPGDRIAIWLPKGIEECWAVFGASMASAIFIPVNPLLKPPQVTHILADSGATVLVTSRQLWNQHTAEFDDSMGGISILFVDDIKPEEQRTRNSSESQIGEDLAAILYTSGSTGRPKGVMLTHSNLIAGARIVRTYLNITSKDRLLSILPISFDYGLNQLLTAVEQGAAMYPMSFKFGDQIVRAIKDFKITGLAGVPSIWAILTRASPSLKKTALPSLRYITNTGGPVPSETVSQLKELLPNTKIFLMYGLTEAFRSTFLDPDELDRRPTSIGKAIPECEVFPINEQGERCGPGEIGILVHRGPTVSKGYWRRPEDTQRVIRPNPLKESGEGAELVCFSGDLVKTDEDGFLYFVGRNDAMIKSGGYRISPAEVEEALMAGGLFRQIAVIGLPDAVLGNRVHAVGVVSVEEPQAGPMETTEDCLARCTKILPNYMVPREIEIVEHLPLSPNGKVDYKQLRADRLHGSNDEN